MTTYNSQHSYDGKLSAFLAGKHERIFCILYDTTRDRNLSRQDFAKLQKKVVAMLRLKPGSEEYKSISDRIGNVWASLMKSCKLYKSNPLQMHLSIPEWLSYWDDFIDTARACGGWPESSPTGDIDYRWQLDFMDLIFDIMDSKHDDEIDAEEYISFLTEFGLSAEECEQAYAKVSQKSSNGKKLDRRRFQELWYEYLTCDEEGVHPGNYLIGNPKAEF